VARRRADPGAIALVLLALVVAALAGSWIWARFSRTSGIAARRTARIVRVQVLNGSGEPGIGVRVAAVLREGGFRVVDVRNADRPDYFASLVVGRSADLSNAREVAHYLGGPPLVLQRWDSGIADVSVLIGSDRSRLRLEP